MVKLRMQGTPQEIQRLLEILAEEKRIMVFDPSAAFDIKGTNRYKRVFAEPGNTILHQPSDRVGEPFIVVSILVVRPEPKS